MLATRFHNVQFMRNYDILSVNTRVQTGLKFSIIKLNSVNVLIDTSNK